MRFAFTLDDAPTIVEEGIPVLPEMMDEMRETLVSCHVAHCVAFVVGERAEGHEASLERWLDAGYELGNHTYFHTAASSVGAQATIESIQKCHEQLEGVGAFQERARYFRFPYLDRGQNDEDRRQIQSACEDLGYTMAPASVDFYDHLFQVPFARAVNESKKNAVLDRYVGSIISSIRASQRHTERFGVSTAQVGYGHFGPITSRALPRIISELRAQGACLCSLEEVLSDPLYKEYGADFSRNGLVTNGGQCRSLGERVAGKINHLAHRQGLFRQKNLGPIWPSLG